MSAATTSDFAQIERVLADYFDGLHHSDTGRLRQALHAQAGYYCVNDDGSLLHLTMPQYLPIVDRRASPASQGHARADRVLSIEFAGPTVALARVACAIPPRAFVDLLSMLKLDGRWWIVSKVFQVVPAVQ